MNKFKESLRVLQSRNLQLYFFGQGISVVGTFMSHTAYYWLIYNLTNSAAWLGALVFFDYFATFISAPIAGVLVDRWNNYKAFRNIQIFYMLLSLITATLVLTGTIQSWHLLPIIICQALIDGFDYTNRQRFIVQLVDNKENIGNAVALNSSIYQAARMIGPGIAGLVIARFGAGVCFSIDSVSYLAVLGSLLLMQRPQQRLLPETCHTTFVDRKLA